MLVRDVLLADTERDGRIYKESHPECAQWLVVTMHSLSRVRGAMVGAVRSTVLATEHPRYAEAISQIRVCQAWAT